MLLREGLDLGTWSVLAMTVFEAFPNAIIRGVWELGRVKRGTVEGVKFVADKKLDVIVDEEASGRLDTTTSAETIGMNTLIYAMPSQLKSANMAKFIGGYYFRNKKTDTYYEIIDAGIGKNQHAGIIEHVEFLIRPTEIAEFEEEC